MAYRDKGVVETYIHIEGVALISAMLSYFLEIGFRDVKSVMII